MINAWRKDYVKTLHELELLPGAVRAIARLTQAGLPVVVVSNQSIIGRGLATAAAVDAVNQAIGREVEKNGGRINAFLYCPHLPDEGCDCRKPRIGLFKQAAQQFDLQLQSCVLVGDEDGDRQAAANAGCAFIRIGDGGLLDLPSAVEQILSSSGGGAV